MPKQLSIPTTSITKVKNPQGLAENSKCAAEGGNVAAVARKELESKTGRSVISPLSAKRFFENQLPNKDKESEEDNGEWTKYNIL